MQHTVLFRRMASILSLVPVKIISSSHLRKGFLTTVTPGLRNRDLALQPDICKAAQGQCAIIKSAMKIILK